MFYFVPVLNCAEMKVPIIFQNFPIPTIKFHDFPGLQNGILGFHVLQVFNDLDEP